MDIVYNYCLGFPFLNTILNRLIEKYGLNNTPTEDIILIWVQKTEKYMNANISPELAGKCAAIIVFSDYVYRPKSKEIINVKELIKLLKNK